MRCQGNSHQVNLISFLRMISPVRASYNSAFTPEAYTNFQRAVAEGCGDQATFRLAETPIFLSKELVDKLLASCQRINSIIADPANLAASSSAIRAPYWSVPGNPEHPVFLQYDYAICQGENGFEPWLIELQGFPSLYCFQGYLAKSYRQHLPVPAGYKSYFNGLDGDSYRRILKQAILNNHDPEHVILLEIEPEVQNTRIDFYATTKSIGIPVVGLENLIREDRNLYYEKDGKRILVKRIYNRVILDELLSRDQSNYQYSFKEEVDVEWAGHPDWFLRISKHTLPLLGHLPNVPATIFASDYLPGSYNLEEYVLKPLYSFSGAGVNLDPKEEDIQALERPQNWIIQRKVAYEPVLQTPSGPAKCEVRMMLVWLPEEPLPKVINNLVRITKGAMTGVKYNKDKDWVGASVAFHNC